MTDQEPDAPHAVKFLEGDLIPVEVVGRLGVSLSTLATWRSSGVGPPYRKIGRKVTYPESELRAWMDRQIVRTERAPTVGPRSSGGPGPNRGGPSKSRPSRFGRLRTRCNL